jgi:hypothetical protein
MREYDRSIFYVCVCMCVCACVCVIPRWNLLDYQQTIVKRNERQESKAVPAQGWVPMERVKT